MHTFEHTCLSIYLPTCQQLPTGPDITASPHCPSTFLFNPSLSSSSAHRQTHTLTFTLSSNPRFALHSLFRLLCAAFFSTPPLSSRHLHRFRLFSRSHHFPHFSLSLFINSLIKVIQFFHFLHTTPRATFALFFPLFFCAILQKSSFILTFSFL